MFVNTLSIVGDVPSLTVVDFPLETSTSVPKLCENRVKL